MGSFLCYRWHRPDLVLVHFIGNDCQSLLWHEYLEAKYGLPEWKSLSTAIAEVFELFHRNRPSHVDLVSMSGFPFRQRLRRSNQH